MSIGSYKVSISAFIENAKEVASQIPDEVQKQGGKIRGVAGMAGTGAAVAFGGSFLKSVELDGATAKIAGQLGLSEKETARLGKQAGGLYAQNYGDSIADTTNSLAVVQNGLKGMKNASDEALVGATKDAINFAKVFETDVPDAVNKANILIKSGLAKNSEEAFDIMTAGAQKVGPALSGDLADAGEEYAQFFDSIGLNGAQAYGVLTSNADKGVYGIDKAGDAVKEFAIRATDLDDKGAQDAMLALGLNGKKMSADLLAGGDRAAAATQKITGALLDVKDPSKQASLSLALFGTPLEDLGKRNIPKFLTSLNSADGGLKNFKSSSEDLDSTLSNTAGGAFQLWKRGFEVAFIELTNDALPFISKVGGFVAKYPGIFKLAAVGILALAGAWVAVKVATATYSTVVGIVSGVTKAWAAIQWIMNSALLANPITWIVLGIIALVAIIVLVATKTTFFQDTWALAWGGIKAVFGNAWTAIKTIFTVTWAAIKMVFAAGINWIKTKANDILVGFQAVKGGLSSVFHGIFDPLKNAFRTVYNFIAAGWNSIDFSIPSVDTKIPGIGVVGGMSINPPNIPMLANGGITTGPMLAMIGDNPGGREAVIPLDKLDKMMSDGPMNDGRGSRNVTINQTVPVRKNMLEYHQMTKSGVNQAMAY